MIRDHFDDTLELDKDFVQSAFPFGEELEYKPTAVSAIKFGGSTQTSAEWFARAERRRELADHYLWHEGRSIYTDLDTVTGKQSLYDTATTFWPMWSGMASEHQADKMMSVPHSLNDRLATHRSLSSRRRVSLPKFGESNLPRSMFPSLTSRVYSEAAGGLLSGTETSRGKITLNRPNRQWE